MILVHVRLVWYNISSYVKYVFYNIIVHMLNMFVRI